MKFFAITLATLAAALPAFAQQMMINTPVGVIQCQPLQLSWSGGKGPYFLSFVPAGQPSAPALKQFPTQTGTQFTWLVDLGSGSTFTIVLKDSTGATAFSDFVTVQASSDNSCLNSAVADDGNGGTFGSSTSAGSDAPTSSGASGASSTGSATISTSGSAAPTGSITSKPSGSGSSSAPKTSSTGSSNTPSDAGKNTISAVALAALMGVVGAALV